MDPLKEFTEKTREILAWMQEEFSHIRSNRPTPKLIEHIAVAYGGAELQVNQLGSISVNPPRDLFISPWDRQAGPAIAKAIEAANLGLSVGTDANGVRVTLPQLSEERRGELVRLVKTLAEEARIKMRGGRDKIMKQVNELTEDEKFRAKANLQKLVDTFNAEVDTRLAAKSGELVG